MEHYLKILEDGTVIPGEKKAESADIVYDENTTFKDFDEGYEWLNKKFGVEKREIQYIHQLDI